MTMTIHEKIKVSEYVLYADNEILIALDFDPITKGHVLILPQRNYKDIDEVPEQVLNRIFKAAQVYVDIINSKYSPIGYSIMQNGGDFNDINVFHLHVFPRFKEEEFGYRKTSNNEMVSLPEFRTLLEIEIMKTRENNS